MELIRKLWITFIYSFFSLFNYLMSLICCYLHIFSALASHNCLIALMSYLYDLYEGKVYYFEMEYYDACYQ